MNTSKMSVLALLASLVFVVAIACTTQQAPPQDEHADEEPAAVMDDHADGDSHGEESAEHDDGDAHEEVVQADQAIVEDQEDGHAHSTDDKHGAIDGAELVTLHAEDIRYAPAKLEIPAGELINVKLVNTGVLEHDFVVEGTDFHLHVMPGAESIDGLEIHEPGEYSFHCSVLGHKEAGMIGTLTVVGMDGHPHEHEETADAAGVVNG